MFNGLSQTVSLWLLNYFCIPSKGIVVGETETMTNKYSNKYDFTRHILEDADKDIHKIKDHIREANRKRKTKTKKSKKSKKSKKFNKSKKTPQKHKGRNKPQFEKLPAANQLFRLVSETNPGQENWWVSHDDGTEDVAEDADFPCGTLSSDVGIKKRRIFGGEDAEKHSHPWIVRIVGGCAGGAGPGPSPPRAVRGDPDQQAPHPHRLPLHLQPQAVLRGEALRPLGWWDRPSLFHPLWQVVALQYSVCMSLNTMR
jgi:hypothetical protein